MSRLAARQFVVALAVLGLAALLRLGHISAVRPYMTDDEAFHQQAAEEVASGRDFPIFFEGNQGNEPLFAYLTAIPILILGPVTWAGRLVSAWAGLLSIALTMRVGAALFPRRWAGVLAGAVLTELYPHLHFSYYGTQPMLSAAAAAAVMATLWSALHTGRRRTYLLVGILLAVGLYAYMAVRLFPLAVAAVWAVWWLRFPAQRRALVWGGGLAGLAAVVLYSPLAWYFVQHPGSFMYRFGQTTKDTLGTAAPLANLADSMLKTIGGIFVQGESFWWYNLPGRPMLDILQSAAFGLGVWASVRQWRQPATGVAWVWLGVGLLPSMLTSGAPSFQRIVMATPALALIVALGLDWLASKLPGRWRWAVVAILLAVSGAWTVRDYFWRWAANPAQFDPKAGRQEWVARALLPAAQGGATLYATPVLKLLPGETYRTLEYLLGMVAFGRFQAFDGRQCLVVPGKTERATTYAVIESEDTKTLPALAAAFPAGSASTIDPGYQFPPLTLYSIPAGQTPQVSWQTPLRVNFGGAVKLLGYSVVPHSDELDVTLIWEVVQATEGPESLFLHLSPAGGADAQRLAQYDGEPCRGWYPSWRWKPGEWLVETYPLSLPPSLARGDYTLRIGWYGVSPAGAGSRLPAYDEAGQALPDETAQINGVHLGPP
jgi:4-amino-4-deoxy-L-arabinose transferase-like glycosyltransferase